MEAESGNWRSAPRLWCEIFAIANLAFLALDIFIAHSVNQFRKWPEFLPLLLSVTAPVALVFANRVRKWWRLVGGVTGALSILVGTAGFLWHLESQFFKSFTLESLVYTAPFAAPLAYTGLGLLLLVNRKVEAPLEWAQWVVFLAWGGFVGNFVFSLADHAQNGFFHWTEWIPVISGALAVGFLVALFLTPPRRAYLILCAEVMGVQIGVGVLGFGLHSLANGQGSGSTLWENIVYGAPEMAPLLFPDLAFLALMGLWAWGKAKA